ncbi:MAG TPA: ATP synthase F1 subunit delta [Tepidisphaeraceae bacterium]|jgi:F-type H+-transporting ATPase subunit delta|nr:ATP synthase F1 subunit delta [Tepidisphaeraceae bacterium]
MASNHDADPVGATYAKPLLQLATEQNQAAQVGEELAQIAEIVRQNKTFGLYLSDPGISNDERNATLTRVFGGKVSPLLHNFLGVLNHRGKLRYLSQISKAYERLLEDQLGNIEVDVTTAQKLSPEQVEVVRQRVSAALGKNAIVHQYVDESILGGLMVRVQDKLIDASVRYQLQAMKQQLLSAAPR